MPTTPDGTGPKTPSGKEDGPSRWRWLKKPTVWVGALITAVITGVLVNLATGAASHVGAHGGAAPNIEVDSVTTQYLYSPPALIRARPVKIDFEIRNTGNQLAIIKAARLTVQQFAALPSCFSAGALVSTGNYRAFLPTDPSPGKSVDIPTAQQVGPGAADRFDITVGLPVKHGAAIYIYRVRIGLLYDNSSVPADAGEVVIALPVWPYVDYMWTRQEAAHPDQISPVVGSGAPLVGRCLVNNSRKLHSILARTGVRPAQLSAVQSQLSTCCGWTLPVVKAQQICGGPALDRPAVMFLSCDGTGILENMKWSAWNFSYATGTGIYRLKNCIPSCANGKVRNYNVTVRFDMPTQTAKNDWLWDRVTFYFPVGSPYGRSTVVQNNLVAPQ